MIAGQSLPVAGIFKTAGDAPALQLAPQLLNNRQSGSDLGFVVDRRASHLLALRVSGNRGHGAALAVRRDHNSTRQHHFPAFLHCEVHGVIVDFRVGAHVFHRIAGDGMIFPIELAGPFVVGRFTFRVGAVDRYFCLEER